MKKTVLTLCLAGGVLGCGEPEGTLDEGVAPEGTQSQAILGDVVSFNGDPNSDLLWRNQSTGNMRTWIMAGPSLAATAVMPAVSPSLVVQAASDFGGPTSDPDLVFHTPASAGTAIRFLNSSFSVLGMAPISGVLPSSSWYVAASGDFNMDGQTDLVLHNRSTGQFFYQYMSGPTPIGISTPLPRALPWYIVGAADFDGDGRTDLLWRHRTSGQNDIWRMNNTAIIGSFPLPVMSLAFYVGATADYTRDGIPDIAWHNPSSGQVVIWRMAGMSLGTSMTVGSMGSGCPPWFSQVTPPPSSGTCMYLVGPR
ncbi:VCBS repeat-containing protein [Myxococcus sp. CA056]|uniref:FG-GAP repeat domain-containing protein n=1 Tax=Myxococcus sp. CA056 TaxID=2741740 RepID=UPI00157A73EE|nr:VCBS repeat-containing protein [Myxococcus sp. CA056]NTX17236.1 VCBS repeat-containing protein [Myxococcus sp. CA056]